MQRQPIDRLKANRRRLELTRRRPEITMRRLSANGLGLRASRREIGRTQQLTRPLALQLRELLRQQLFELQALPGRVAVVLQRGQRYVWRGVMQKQ